MAIDSSSVSNRGPLLTTVGAIFLALGTVIVAQRVYVKAWLLKSFAKDDIVMVIAWLFYVAMIGVLLGEATHGGGKHVGDLTPDVEIEGLRLNFISQPLYIALVCLIKISIILFLLRLANQRAIILQLWAIGTIMTLYSILGLVTNIVQCQPIQYTWNKNIPGGHCFTARTLDSLAYVQAGLNAATDWYLAILPAFMFWNLQLHWTKKVVLITILSLGIIASIATIVKITYIVDYGKTGDFLWDSINLSLWSIIEAGLGIIAACLATLKPFMHAILRRFGISSGIKSTTRTRTRRHTRSFGSAPLGHSQKSQTTSVVQGGASNDQTLPDTGSEEFILPGIIRRTVDVEVTRDEEVEDDDSPV